MHTDNPAARLLGILEKGKAQNKEATARTVWTALLGGDGGGADLAQRLGLVMALPSKILEVLEHTHPTQLASGAHNHWVNTITSALAAHNVDAVWGTFIKAIDSHSMNYLRMAADLIDQAGFKPLSDDQIAEIRQTLTQLMDDVASSDLDLKIKQFMLGRLEQILQALNTYAITGGEGVLEEIEATLGRAFFDEGLRAAFRKETGKRYLSSLAHVANAVTITTGAVGISQGAAWLIEKLS